LNPVFAGMMRSKSWIENLTVNSSAKLTRWSAICVAGNRPGIVSVQVVCSLPNIRDRGTKGRCEMKIVRLQQAATIFGLSTLSACTISDNGYFVKADSSPGTLAGVAELAQLPVTTPSLSLGATFKSNGKVSRSASDVLYETFCAELKARGHWQVNRIGNAGEDFTPEIAAADTADTEAAAPAESSPAAQKVEPQLLVLVEDRPDTSAATEASYLMSGITYGADQVHKPTDRYDVTIAYRDDEGVERVYKGHQDLIFATGSKLFGRDPSPGPGYKRYESSLAAFNGVVDNSVNGTRHGKVTVGEAVVEPAPESSLAVGEAKTTVAALHGKSANAN